jgi:flagellar protein FlaF
MTEAIDISGASLPEGEALQLTQAGIELDQARASGDKAKLAAALDHNLQLWVAIRTMVTAQGTKVPENLQGNLTRLANFVAQTTMKHGVAIPDNVIDTLVNINLQISEGLLEGQKK